MSVAFSIFTLKPSSGVTLFVDYLRQAEVAIERPDHIFVMRGRTAEPNCVLGGGIFNPSQKNTQKQTKEFPWRTADLF